MPNEFQCSKGTHECTCDQISRKLRGAEYARMFQIWNWTISILEEAEMEITALTDVDLP